jgi:16S rRNA (cytosine967-C5)-methyltransferase
LRINSLVGSVQAVLARIPVAIHPAPALPEGVVLEAPFDVQGSELWREGAIMGQSRASMLVARVVAPAAGERVLDLCAAPGGKTTHMAALMEDRGEIVAIERHPGRATALQETCRRMHATRVRVLVQDAAELNVSGAFDRVLLDPPCSGLGTLQSRPDRRWRASDRAIGELSVLQSQLLRAAAAVSAAGATLVYSVCTISQREGEQVIERFIQEHPQWEAEDLGATYPEWRSGRYLQLLPDRDRTDGFFIARLRRGQTLP